MVRLKEVAEAAGVSVMTVSKALRDQSDISAATKSRIRRLAEVLGYTPDATAQGLRSRRTRLVGVIIPAVTDPVFARALLGIEEQAFALGFDVLLGQTLGNPEREENIIRKMLSRRVDGLLIAPVFRFEAKAAIYEILKVEKIPVVILGPRASTCREFVGVESDDSGGAAAICRHLVELGHRRIAFFAGPPSSPWAQERLAGYRRVCRSGELEPDDSCEFNAGNTIEEGAAAAHDFLREGARATAIQAVNDFVAVGAARVLVDAGWVIPDRFSIAGYGNFLIAEQGVIPLTTVRQPKKRLGEMAFKLLNSMLRGETVAAARLNVDLVIRRSTGNAIHDGKQLRLGFPEDRERGE